MMHVAEAMTGKHERLLALTGGEYATGDLANLAHRIMAAHRLAGAIGERVANIPDSVWRLAVGGMRPADIEWRFYVHDKGQHGDLAHVRLAVVLDRGARESRSVEITGIAAAMWVNTSGSILTSSRR